MKYGAGSACRSDEPVTASFVVVASEFVYDLWSFFFLGSLFYFFFWLANEPSSLSETLSELWNGRLLRLVSNDMFLVAGAGFETCDSVMEEYAP